ncbi:MAG: DUF547 domain-containing protein [Planctomycetota bacterium]|jgi:hypothetical protein
MFFARQLIFSALVISVFVPGLALGDAQEFSYDGYATVLSANVDSEGMVNYKVLTNSRDKLDSFVESMANLDSKTFEKWEDNAKIAFWLNAYNSLTLKAIIDNYPIKAGFFKSRIYPKNSIRQISGVWDKIKFDVMGKKYTLEHIEHKILRVEFNEPRIHMAMVCAAIGCPPLRNEPYIAKKLDAQLEDQSNKFLANPEKFRLEEAVVYISPIFKWFASDFVKTYGKGGPFAGNTGAKAAVLRFVSEHLDETIKKEMETKKLKIKYLDYDWSLNEQN